MSGGDSGISFGGNGTTEVLNCMELFERVRLSSVKEEILNSLKVNDILKIEKYDKSVVAVTSENKIVGSIAGISIKDIIYCLENGYVIIGTVEEINDGSCILVIRCDGKAQ
ncbi:hypothetical protein AF80_06425 [Aliarcobacter butzleri L355]|uniref:Uncharacterized protein n=1 Tax=Aliarcobacter butzleri L355 TaxID=1447263 RepID=A0A0G9KZ41_9BACT|nr:hypothetical protein [Aliarcobacter butzleri]KLE09438.1 hypothetical protein AF80_06425 [Aliarcobacter butzleri L355]BAK71721.1 hypothetical protein ABED_2004 [Aliarcobacter butzleri ED-1]